MRAICIFFLWIWAGVHGANFVNSALGFPGRLMSDQAAAGLDYWLSYLASRSASVVIDAPTFVSMLWPFSGYFGDYDAAAEAGGAAARAFWIVYAGHLLGGLTVIAAAAGLVFFTLGVARRFARR